MQEDEPDQEPTRVGGRIPIDEIRVPPKIQATTDFSTVDRYVQAIRRYEKLPPLDVFYDPCERCYWLAEGLPRLAAAKRCGWSHVLVRLHDGGEADAVVYGERMAAPAPRRWRLECEVLTPRDFDAAAMLSRVFPEGSKVRLVGVFHAGEVND